MWQMFRLAKFCSIFNSKHFYTNQNFFSFLSNAACCKSNLQHKCFRISSNFRDHGLQNFPFIHSSWWSHNQFKPCSSDSKSDPISHETVYIGSLTKTIKLVKWFSISTSAIGLALQPFVIIELLKQELPLFVILPVTVLGGTVIVVTPLLLFWISRRYVTEILFNSEQNLFIAKTLKFFNGTKVLTYNASDVYIPDLPGIFTTFLAKGTPLFIDPRMVRHPVAYRHMMGYDKPLNLRLKSSDNKVK